MVVVSGVGGRGGGGGFRARGEVVFTALTAIRRQKRSTEIPNSTRYAEFVQQQPFRNSSHLYLIWVRPIPSYQRTLKAKMESFFSNKLFSRLGPYALPTVVPEESLVYIDN